MLRNAGGRILSIKQAAAHARNFQKYLRQGRNSGVTEILILKITSPYWERTFFVISTTIQTNNSSGY